MIKNYNLLTAENKDFKDNCSLTFNELKIKKPFHSVNEILGLPLLCTHFLILTKSNNEFYNHLEKK